MLLKEHCNKTEQSKMHSHEDQESLCPLDFIRLFMWLFSGVPVLGLYAGDSPESLGWRPDSVQLQRVRLCLPGWRIQVRRPCLVARQHFRMLMNECWIKNYYSVTITILWIKTLNKQFFCLLIKNDWKILDLHEGVTM